MKYDKVIGICLVLGSLVAVLLMGMYFLGSGEGSIPWALLIWPAIGFLVGLTVIFADVLEGDLDLKDEIEELPELLADDVEALKKGRITLPILYGLFAICAFVFQIVIVVYYRKWFASWGPFNVMVLSAVVVLIALWLSLRGSWFQSRYEPSSWYMFAIPAAAWLICLAIGVYWAEPKEYNAMSPMERNQLAQSDSYWSSTRGGNIYFINSYSSGSSDVGIDCHGDSCEGLVYLLVALVCIAGSAIIPHFWVLATSLLLTLMIIVALREILFNEDVRPRYAW